MGSMGEIKNSSLKTPPLVIPPRPEVVSILLEEKESETPDLRRVARAIMADVGLSGAMLKAVNSPAFALRRKVSSIAAALDLLGMNNVTTLATGLILRHVGGEGAPGMDRFWDSAEKVAIAATYIAGRLRGIPKDQAYTYGLFHDCGIPLLIQRYPEYKELLAQANQTVGQIFTVVEDRALGTHHAAVGYFLARSWHLSEDLCQAILLHHEIGVFESVPRISEGALNLIGIGHMAEHVHHQLLRSGVDAEWEKFEISTCRHFGLDEEECFTLLDDAQSFLAS